MTEWIWPAFLPRLVCRTVILCNIAFEHGWEMSVDEVRAAARSLVAYEPVGEKVNMQAAAAPCVQGQGKRKNS